jgi:SAM-dependent methyltransferase
MEVIQSTSWLDPEHPNYLRWKNARELSFERGKFVYSVINQQLQTKNLKVLDLGSGEGGTAKVFSLDNFVVSFDLSLIRLNRQKENVISSETTNKHSEINLRHFDPDLSGEKSESNNIKDFSVEDSFEMTAAKSSSILSRVNGTALQLPFSNNSFDLIIIQDVIEHLTGVGSLYNEIKRILKPGGSIYLSTPNKLSFFNFITDPHFGLPIVSVLKRQSIKKYFLKYFRTDDYHRSDIAELLSLNQVKNLFNNDFEFALNTKFSVQQLFNGDKGIVWSNFHLKLIAFCKIIKLDKLILKLSNDRPGFINKYFTPTFYLMLKRKQITNNLN